MSIRLQMRHVKKSFGATQALAGVDLDLAAGEVVALIGENGAGKSTLMKVLSGVHQPDAGEMLLEGDPYKPVDPLHARSLGIVMIYQELTLAAELSVAENILLGVEPKRFGFVNKALRDEQAAGALQRLGRTDIDLHRPVSELSIAQQQMVEIARAMVTTPKVLVLDEPTSSLTADDTEHLFQVIERLRDQGVAVIYISHFLEECQRLASRFVVLRDGESVATGAMAAANEDKLIQAMVGRSVDELYPSHAAQAGAVLLDVQHLSGLEIPEAVDLQVRAGEVVGLFGLIGSGRTELLRCIFGLDPVRAGSVVFAGQDVTGASPARCWKQGIGLVSENRKEEGLLLVRDLADNLTLSDLSRYRRGPLLRVSQQHQATDEWIATVDVRCRDSAQPIGDLSGGNQQKIAIARLLHHNCRLLILDEPTRGIDVAAKARIYQLIAEQADAGKAVLVVSSYVPELLGICDSLAVMCRGHLGPVKPVADWTEEALMAAAIGADGPDGIAVTEESEATG